MEQKTGDLRHIYGGKADKIHENLHRTGSLDRPADCKSGLVLRKVLATYEEKVLMALRDYEPSVITRFILDVAVAFNRFYHNCRILSESDESIKQTRIALTLATKHVLGSAFEMICLKKTEKI